MKQIKFTKEGLLNVENERDKLLLERKPAVLELSRARELGDLSENGLYHAAKTKLRSIDSQLRRLSNQIKLAVVVSSKKFLVEQDGRQVEYEIVGDYEADPASFKISANSPIGQALIYSKTGEQVEIQTPKGTVLLKIIKVI